MKLEAAGYKVDSIIGRVEIAEQLKLLRGGRDYKPPEIEKTISQMLTRAMKWWDHLIAVRLAAWDSRLANGTSQKISR